MNYIRKKAEKKLFKYKSFFSFKKIPEDVEVVFDSSILGEAIGVYKNIPNSMHQSIIIGEFGIQILLNNSSETIKFSEMQEIDLKKNDNIESDRDIKYSYEQIIIKTRTGRNFAMPVKNGDGKFRDIFGFYSFLKRAIWYYNNYSNLDETQ